MWARGRLGGRRPSWPEKRRQSGGPLFACFASVTAQLLTTGRCLRTTITSLARVLPVLVTRAPALRPPASQPGSSLSVWTADEMLLPFCHQPSLLGGQEASR